MPTALCLPFPESVKDVARVQANEPRGHAGQPPDAKQPVLPADRTRRGSSQHLGLLPFCSIGRLSDNDCVSVIWNLDLEEK